MQLSLYELFLYLLFLNAAQSTHLRSTNDPSHNQTLFRRVSFRRPRFTGYSDCTIDDMQHLERLLTTHVARMAAIAAAASDPERHSWFYSLRFGQYFHTQTPGHKLVIRDRFNAVYLEADETPTGKIHTHCRYDPEGGCRATRFGTHPNYPLSYHINPDTLVLVCGDCGPGVELVSSRSRSTASEASEATILIV